jgi:pimeloyl-ACP methyl ester carboxylesterase
MRSDPDDRCQTLALPDGRRLTYTVTGPAGGTPVVYCHGAIGTPLDATVDLERMTARLGIRYIAPSRPGVGGSDPSPGRTIVDFAADLRHLVDALGIDRFSVIGVSAGGPYALATARQLGDRVRRIAVCSSLSPLCAPHRTPGMNQRIRLALAALARAPQLCERLGDAVLPVITQHPVLLSHVIAAHAAPQERERLARPSERSAASHSFLDAACGGVGGMIEDYLVYSGEWGFSPAEVPSEVHLWHGGRDPLVPVEHALQLASTLPRCRIFFDPDEGHHFFRSNLPRILAVLAGRDAEPGRGLETTVGRARSLAAHHPGAGRRRPRRRSRRGAELR